MLRQFRFSLSLAILACVGSLPALSQDRPTTVPCDPQTQAQLGELTERVLSRADRAGCRKRNCTILVANFAGPSGTTSLLGIQLADAISARFALQAKDIQIVDRNRLRSFLEQERIPSKLLEDDRAAGWLASRLSASAVLVGSLKKKKTGVQLSVQLLNAQDTAKKKPKMGSIEEVVLALQDADSSFAPVEPFGGISHSDTNPQGEKIFTAGKDGTTMPSCHYVPDPAYTNEARAAKFQGTVLFDVTIMPDQQVMDVHVVRGAPFGLNDAARNTVATWKCKPVSRNGVPVPARVNVEITFRLF